MSKVLVTGGMGFIGSHLSEHLLKLDHEVVVIDNLSTGNIDNLKDCECNFIKYDITDNLNDIFEYYKFDYVFHLAAQINLRHSIKYPLNDANINILGSLNVLENAYKYGVKRVIFSSTGGAIYSEKNTLPFTEESVVKPTSPYGISKKSTEDFFEFFKNVHNLNSTILRYSNVYGSVRQNSKSEAGVIAIFINRALKGEDLYIFGDGMQTRDFVQFSDVIKANVLAMEKELNGVYNVSSNIQTSVLYLAKKIIELTGSKSKIIFKDRVDGEMLYTQLSAKKLESHGWKSNFNIDQGLKETLKYFGK